MYNQQSVANLNHLLKELSKYEDKESDPVSQLRKYAHDLNTELEHLWFNSSVYIGPVGKKEIRHMAQYCKCRPNIKYLIFDYRERFASSQQQFNERAKIFKGLGVKVVFLNTGDIPDFYQAYHFVLRMLKEVNRHAWAN